jgi:hypothetical protein
MPTRYEVLPIPARMDHTQIYSAGPIQFGVEYRLLNEALIAEEFGDDARAKFGNDTPAHLADQIDEDGVSIHVFDQSGSREVLRFDCFDDYPHYHYIDTDVGHQTVHDYDAVAHGPMHEWVIDCLTHRLPEMLVEAGAGELAQGIDSRTLEAVLPDVALAIERARKAGRPILAEASAQAV